MSEAIGKLPPTVEYLLTRRVPCGVVAALLFSLVVLVPKVSAFLAFLLLPGLLALHLFTPGLFALISFGGGVSFASQVALIGAAVVWLLAGFKISAALVFLLLYALVPLAAARALMREGGLARSSVNLFSTLALAVIAALVAGSMAEGKGLSPFVGDLLAPIFAEWGHTLSGVEETARLAQVRAMTIAVFPGMMGVLLWAIWFSVLLLARRLALRFGFYVGDRESLLQIRFGVGVAYLFAGLLLAGLLLADGAQYLAITATIMVGALLALQGLMVVHSWLDARRMGWTIVAMYLVVLISSTLVIPFVALGFLDIWYDFRRRFTSAAGG